MPCASPSKPQAGTTTTSSGSSHHDPSPDCPGLFAPPFGLCYYAACIIGGVAPESGMRRIWIYLGALFLGLLVLTFVPWFSIGFL
ncbi:hypothetical protein DA075_30395 [Methylobacterium currus]|uniref:TRAP C4-dicarboxylate transport system permease DctM subunit domain-containing protein n=1 Tax=Methylobacterium currus TaxID=2051553 RepID=A0A2R4WUN6_9HYPH|nr:hypothetical protein DA075_30395 [Methylobacterium currus]